jgi:hypothetical protein
MTLLNTYDEQIYAFGMGPTQTTVQTPLASIILGHTLVIQGTVMDVSAGASQQNVKARFPSGLPAVADDNQSAWMEYVYMQNPKPGNIVGVPVTITIVDPNGNAHTASLTSDQTGTFSLQVPTSMTPVPGKYTVVAEFAGSNAYWGSYAESTFAVDPAPAATPTPTPTPASVVSTYFVPAVVAIIIVIIIIGAIIMLMLSRRPRL